jgi:hypothetical protein
MIEIHTKYEGYDLIVCFEELMFDAIGNGAGHQQYTLRTNMDNKLVKRQGIEAYSCPIELDTLPLSEDDVLLFQKDWRIHQFSDLVTRKMYRGIWNNLIKKGWRPEGWKKKITN